LKTAFLFPGQGAKGALEALAFAASEARGRELLSVAAEASGIRVERMAARGGRELEKTEVLQPVLTAIGIFVAEELRAGGCPPDVVAGHSLGEIAASAAAGWLAPEDAVRIAALRGKLMAREAAKRPGGLLAIETSDEGVIAEALERGRRVGSIAIGAINAPDEVVLTGDLSSLGAVAAAFPSRRLAVAGAWHSEAMLGAVEELRAALRESFRAESPSAVVSDRDGLLTLRGEDLIDRLAEQIALPVLWSRALGSLAAMGVTDYVAIAPGAVLRGLLYKFEKHRYQNSDPGEPRPRVHSAEDRRDIERALQSLSGAARLED
jgi:[acyl-carrier-protein] S-malonyltransferase